MEENTNVNVEGLNVGANTETTNETPQEQSVKTYTEAELQAEADRRVSKALETSKAKWEKDYEAKVQQAKDEAAKLAKMSAEERARAEFEKEKATFEAERNQYNTERLTFECSKQLANENLPIEFAELLTGKDAETTKENIATFKDAFAKAIDIEVSKRLQGKPPKMGTQTNEETDPFLKGFLSK